MEVSAANTSIKNENSDGEPKKKKKALGFALPEEASPKKVSIKDEGESKKKKKALGFALPEEAPSKKKVSMKDEGEPKKKKKAIGFALPEDEGPTKKAPSGASAGNNKKPKAGNNNQSKPDWYEELSMDQVSMFKEVFEMLDRDGGGSIDAEELYAVMKEMDIEISLEEIKDVLAGLDSDGNGEIDFDEFLYAMTETDRYLDSLADGKTRDEEKYSRRQTLFFTAITKFAMKNSLGEIERYYAAKARKVPHVISHYTAGVRLDGLNDKQLATAMRRMQKDAKKCDSPYAKPLPFVRLDSEKPRAKQTVTSQPPPAKKSGTTEEEETETPEISPESSINMLTTRKFTPRRGAASMLSNEEVQLLNTLRDMANKGSVVAKLPNVHLVPQIRAKLADGTVGVLVSSRRKKKRLGPAGEVVTPEQPLNRAINIQDRISMSGDQRKHAGWRIPRIDRQRAPLPVIHLDKGKCKEVTIEDVPLIRKKVSFVLDEYYAALKKAHVTTAWNHWYRLYTEEIRPQRLLENFRKVYKAYSPHKEDEVFVICPWIPGRVPQHHMNRLACSSASPNEAYGRRAVTPNSLKTTITASPGSGSSSSSNSSKSNSPLPRSRSCNSYYQ